MQVTTSHLRVKEDKNNRTAHNWIFKRMDEQGTSGDHSSYFAPLH